MAAYVLIIGVPVFTVLFCVALNIVGKRLFAAPESDEPAGGDEG